MTFEEKRHNDVRRCAHIYKNKSKYGQSEKNYFNSRPKHIREAAMVYYDSKI